MQLYALASDFGSEEEVFDLLDDDKDNQGPESSHRRLQRRHDEGGDGTQDGSHEGKDLESTGYQPQQEGKVYPHYEQADGGQDANEKA